jgi:MFS family permease
VIVWERKALILSSIINELFHYRLVKSVLVSQFFLLIGIWVRNVAILLYVMHRTGGDPFAISMISVAEYAPILVFSFIGGTLADRWRPKRTMVCCDLLSAVSVFIVLLVFMFGTWKAVFFVTMVSAIMSQFSQPSGMKLFKLHLSENHMQAAISVYQSITAVFIIFGPLLGTFVFFTFGVNISIAVMGIAFLISAGALCFLPQDCILDYNKPQTTLRQEFADGISYVLSRKVLKLLGLCYIATGSGLGLIQPLGIFLVTERLRLPLASIQWFMAANGAGVILGGVLAMVFAKTIKPQKLLIVGLTISTFSIAAAGLSTYPWLTLIAFFFGSLVIPLITVGINTVIMQNIEEAFVGRVNGIITPLYIGSMLVMMSLAGLFKAHFSLVTIYETSALLFIIGLSLIMPLYQHQTQRDTTRPTATSK